MIIFFNILYHFILAKLNSNTSITMLKVCVFYLDFFSIEMQSHLNYFLQEINPTGVHYFIQQYNHF